MRDRIDAWKKEHYKKAMMQQYKSYKRAQSAFEKVRGRVEWVSVSDNVGRCLWCPCDGVWKYMRVCGLSQHDGSV